MLISGNIYRTYLRFLLPTLGSMILFSSYTMVDGIFVGQGVGATALSAVNVSLPFTTVMFALAMLISIGTSNMITYQLGQKHLEKANKFFSLGIAISAGLSFLIAAFSFYHIDLILSILGAKESIRSLAHDYLHVIILFSPFFALTYVFEIFIKADGHPKLAIFLTSLSALTNIALDYIFIYIFHLGVYGAAVATGLAQLVPSLGYCLHFLSKRSNLSFTPFRFHFTDFIRIVRFGIPSALTELASGFTILLFNHSILTYYGTEKIASFSVIVYLMTLITNTMIAILQSGQPLISYSFGAEAYFTMKKLRRMIFLTIAISSIVLVALIQIFPRQIIAVFLSQADPTFVQFTVKAIREFSLAFLLLGFNIGIGGYLTAVHRPDFELIISLLRGYVVICAVLTLAPRLLGAGAIWFSLAISEAITLVCSSFLLKRRLTSLKALAARSKEGAKIA